MSKQDDENNLQEKVETLSLENGSAELEYKDQNDEDGNKGKKINDNNDEDSPTISDNELEEAVSRKHDSENGNDDDDVLSNEGDSWIEELECALLADCDPGTLKKITEGKRIPTPLRPDFWRALLSLNDAVRVKLNNEYDLENQLQIRHDCDVLIKDINNNVAIEPLSDADRLKLRSDFETCITTYVKARPELSYIPGNGWTDILKVLYHLQLSDVQLYQMFLRIVDRYIPKNLFHKSASTISNDIPNSTRSAVNIPNNNNNSNELSNNNYKNEPVTGSNCSYSKDKDQTSKLPKTSSQTNLTPKLDNNSIQAYHLLRLLIQYHDPELCSILDSKKVTPNLYVKDWFCSLFARSCSPKLALLIWDTHLKMADPFLIFFAAIVMVANASDELKKSQMTQEKMLQVLNGMPSQLEEEDIEDLYYLVSNHYTNSTPRSIRSYSHLFFMDTFANTYTGNETPEERSPLFDLKTSQLTSSLDLSQYLCLPIVPAEIFIVDTAQYRSSPTQSASTLKYFLVDCRPAEQYNAGHLVRAFHLDCSLMLREPSSFATAVQALLEIQRQVVASKSNTGGQHVCFIGSGQEEEDKYLNMVVASFLQKYQKYVSIVVGGFDAIHDYVSCKSEFKDSFNKYIVDHNPDLCKTCYSRIPEDQRVKREMANQMSGSGASKSGLASAQSLFASTTSFLRGDKSSLTKLASTPQATATANLIAQSSASMFDKFTTAFVSKSSVIKDKLVETLNTTNIPSATNLASSSLQTGHNRGHVSSKDKLGKRYTGNRYAIDDNDDDLSNRFIPEQHKFEVTNEPVQEIQIEAWQRENKLIALHKCSEIKGNSRYPGFIALTSTHMWILREIPHNKGFASIAAKRPLDMIVQITSKRRQPDLIIFRYGYNDSSQRAQQQKQLQTKGPTSVSDDEKPSSPDGAEPNQPQTSRQSKPAPKPIMPTIVASDQLHIPQAFEVIRLIKREIIRVMDENPKKIKVKQEASEEPKQAEAIETQPVSSKFGQPLLMPDSPDGGVSSEQDLDKSSEISDNKDVKE